MLDIPGQPELDKASLVGGCLRLPLTFDAGRMQQEVAGLPESVWGTTGGRVGVHRAAQALFLRGYAPAEGNKPIVDRPPLDLLPYARHIIEHMVPGTPMRCLLARLPAGKTVAPHIDQAPYFAKTLRLHFPVQTHDMAWLYCAGATHLMKPGEIWALNNSDVHGVWNEHATDSRTHMICDFLPASALLALLARGERDLGQRNDRVEQHLFRANPGDVDGG